MFLLFSHNLEQNQINQAREKYNINQFISLPNELQNKWSNVPPQLESLENYALIFKEFLKENSKKGDFVLIQGDFGLSYIMVEFSKTLALVPLYATTNRNVKERIKDNKKIKESVFEHGIFRKY